MTTNLEGAPGTLVAELSPGPRATELLGSLSKDEAEIFATTLAETRERRGHELEQSIDNGLAALPRPLRKPVRAVLFPGSGK